MPSSPPPHSARSEWLLFALPGIIWGASFLFIAEGLQALPPDGITFLRFVFGFATLAGVPGARRAIDPADRWKVALLGLIWMALPMSMFPHAEQHVSSALTGMLNGAIPLIAATVAATISRKAPPRIAMVGLAVGFAGAVLMALPGIGEGGSSARGILMISFALVCYGFAVNLARPLQQRNGALPVVWRAMGVALLVTAPIGLPALREAKWELWPLAAVVALGVLGTAIANVLMAMAVGRMGATRASANAFIIPVVAFLLGILVRGESVPGAAIAGGGMCLCGAWLLRRAAHS